MAFKRGSKEIGNYCVEFGNPAISWLRSINYKVDKLRDTDSDLWYSCFPTCVSGYI
jgi:hypothetical protein